VIFININGPKLLYRDCDSVCVCVCVCVWVLGVLGFFLRHLILDSCFAHFHIYPHATCISMFIHILFNWLPSKDSPLPWFQEHFDLENGFTTLINGMVAPFNGVEASPTASFHWGSMTPSTCLFTKPIPQASTCLSPSTALQSTSATPYASNSTSNPHQGPTTLVTTTIYHNTKAYAWR